MWPLLQATNRWIEAAFEIMQSWFYISQKPNILSYNIWKIGEKLVIAQKKLI